MTPAAATETLTAPASGVGARFRPTTAGWAARAAVLVVIFGGLLVLTAIVPNYWALRIALAAIYAIIGLSLNVVLGYVGQVSLGHHGFVGIGAFVSAYYVTEQANCTLEGCPLSAFGTAMALSILCGAVAASLLGLVALRIKGLYLALITLAFGFTAERSIFEISSLTRGGAGMPAPRPDGFTGGSAFAYLCLAFLAIVLFIDWRLIRSKVGRAILSIKHSEAVASSYAINVTAYKVLAFLVSGVFAGVAGSLFAFRATNVVAANFVFQTALLWVLMIVVGGLGNRTGVVIGSAFFALFPFLVDLIPQADSFFQETIKRSPAEFSIVVGAVLAVFTIVQFPGGIAEQIAPITRWLRGDRFYTHEHGEPHKAQRKRLRLPTGKRAAGPAEEEAEDAHSPELVEAGEKKP